jgi:hypothetical protein
MSVAVLKPRSTRIFRRCLPHHAHPHQTPGQHGLGLQPDQESLSQLTAGLSAGWLMTRMGAGWEGVFHEL